MDSHADSPVVGKNASIISTQDRKITVLEPKELVKPFTVIFLS